MRVECPFLSPCSLSLALLLAVGLTLGGIALTPDAACAASSHKSSTSKQARQAQKHTSVKPAARAKSTSRGKAASVASVAKTPVQGRKAGKAVDPSWMQRARNPELLGKASWYGSDFHGGPTASGVPYDMHAYTAAHRTLPMGTVVQVTEQHSGRSVMVCISDHGPFLPGRVIDLSYAAASDLGMENKGVVPVNLKVVSDSDGNAMHNKAFYVRLPARQASREELVGPFRQFADATALKEILRVKHPNAAIVLGDASGKP